MDYRRRKIGKTTWIALLMGALFSSYVFGTGDPLHDASRLGKDASRMFRDMGFGR